MKFGIDLRNKKTGADISVLIFQLVSILPAFYVFCASGYIAILDKRNALTVMFDFGLCSLPRWEMLLLSFLYRLTSSEMAPYFAMLIIALVLGIAAKRCLRGNEKKSIILHFAFSTLIIIDLILRILPLSFNSAFPLAYSVGAASIRAVCLALLIGDLVAYRRLKNTNINR